MEQATPDIVPQSGALSHYPLWGLAAALAILVAIATVSLYSIYDYKRDMETVARSHDILSKSSSAISLAKDMVLGERGYLITAQEQYVEVYTTALNAIPQQINSLNATINHPEMHPWLPALVTLTAEIMAEADLAIAQKKSGKSAAWAMDTSKSNLVKLRALEKQMKQDEALLLVQRQQESESSANRTFVIVIGGNFVGFALLLTVFVKLRQENMARLHAEAGLRKANQELKAANKELESFSYSVSHDLRSPLRAMDGFAKMLEEDYDAQLGEEGRHAIQRIRTNSQRMGRLIDDLLAFSRVGRQSMALTQVNMQDLAREIWQELISHCDPRPQIIWNELAPTLGDRAMLRQVWVNLLSNAVKFSSGRAQPVIEVSCRRQGEENVCCVKDNGAGFDMRYYDKLFGVFQRLHSSEEFPGTGVGLAIVQRVVNKHGGRVWAEGKVGEGAAFYFTLPIRSANE